MARKIFAYAWASGLIEFGSTVPEGAIAIARDYETRLRCRVDATARHARSSDALIVPGVPEAADDEAALDAMIAWISWAFTPRSAA